MTNAARDKRPGAAAELARFLAEIQFRDEKTHKKTPSAKTSMFYSPASCDSALERAATADVVTALLADPKTSAAEAADVFDAVAAAVAVTTSNTYKKTPPRGGSRFAASFCLLGGCRWTLARLGTTNDDPIASLTRASAAGLIAALARNGSVAARVAASCGALETLSFFLATENAYAGADRNAVRRALDAALALCFPDEDETILFVREGWMERDVVSDVSLRDANDANDDGALSSLGFDETLSPYEASNDGTTSACVASGAAARAGLAPALARLLAPLNVAAREESAGKPTGTDEGKDDDPTASTPSGRARDAAAWALGRLIAAPDRAGALARRSVFSASVAATHAFLGVVGSPAMPPRLSRALLKTLHHASRDPVAAQGLRAAGATPKLARCLQREDAAARESAMRALRNVCLLGESADGGTGTTHPSATALEHAVVAGATPHLVAVAVSSGDEPRRFVSQNDADANANANATTDGGGVGAGVANGANGDATHWHRDGAIVSSSLRDVAVALLCAAASSGSRTCRARLKDSGALEALAELAFPRLPERTSHTHTKRLFSKTSGEKTRASYAATRALDAWLEDEPWIVEARLMESDVVQAAVAAVAAVAADRRAADGRTRRRAKAAAEAALGATPVAAAVDDETVDALAGAAARSPRWAGALAAGGVADATLASLEKLVEGVATPDSREGLTRNDVSVSSAAGAVASRARLLAAVGECDPKAREWIRGAFVVDRLDALATKCERFQQSAKAWRPAAAAARDASARLRRRG